MITCTIVCPAPDPVALSRLLAVDDASTKRSTVDIKKQAREVIISIEAQDATALRASAAAVTRLLAIHERAERKDG